VTVRLTFECLIFFASARLLGLLPIHSTRYELQDRIAVSDDREPLPAHLALSATLVAYTVSTRIRSQEPD